jgi:hypothetical protein
VLAIAMGGVPESTSPTPTTRMMRRESVVRMVERIAAP